MVRVACISAGLVSVGCSGGLLSSRDGGGEGLAPGECVDGADNDGNGLYDCSDPGCYMSSDCADTGTDTGTDSQLIGVWVRTVKQNGITQEVQFTFESTGDCELLLNIPDFGPYPISCTYSTSGDEMEISDTECEGDGYGSGTYSFTASSSTLSMSTLSDDCPTRSPIPGDWTRSSR